MDDADTYENFEIYLKRNPDLCFLALINDTIIGALKCGQDGRRGYLHHLSVKKEFRDQGIGKALYLKCINSLKKQGIKKCNLFVKDGNQTALNFWQANGWKIINYDYRTLQRDLMVD
jgi:ribosomal protein S18 acetylase RimI-like enzyme